MVNELIIDRYLDDLDDLENLAGEPVGVDNRTMDILADLDRAEHEKSRPAGRDLPKLKDGETPDYSALLARIQLLEEMVADRDARLDAMSAGGVDPVLEHDYTRFEALCAMLRDAPGDPLTRAAVARAIAEASR